MQRAKGEEVESEDNLNFINKIREAKAVEAIVEERKKRLWSWYVQYAHLEDTFPGIIPNIK
jgi:hypothetical protein